jgi:hypothetical protein
MADLATKGGRIATGMPNVFIGKRPPAPWAGPRASLFPAQYHKLALSGFVQSILDIAGMTVQDSIDLYAAPTGEDLPPYTVEPSYRSGGDQGIADGGPEPAQRLTRHS